MPYIKDNIRTYLEENFEQRNAKTDFENLRCQAVKDSNAPQIPGADSARATLIEATVNYVAYCVDAKIENKAITLLVWKASFLHCYKDFVFAAISHVVRWLQATTNRDSGLLRCGYSDTEVAQRPGN